MSDETHQCDIRSCERDAVKFDGVHWLCQDHVIPPMPKSQEEWEAHWAFYRLTVMQRDAAWREIERLRRAIR